MIAVYSLLAAMALIFFLLGYLLHAFYGNRSRLLAIKTAVDRLSQAAGSNGSLDRTAVALAEPLRKAERQLDRIRGDLAGLGDALEVMKQDNKYLRSLLLSGFRTPGSLVSEGSDVRVSPNEVLEPVTSSPPDTVPRAATPTSNEEPAQPWRKNLNSILESIEDEEDH